MLADVESGELVTAPSQIKNITVRLKGEAVVIEHLDGSLLAEIEPHVLIEDATFTSIFARHRMYDAKATGQRLRTVVSRTELSVTQRIIAKMIAGNLAACTTKDAYMAAWRKIGARCPVIAREFGGTSEDARKVAGVFDRTHLCFCYPKEIAQLEALCAGSLRKLYRLAKPLAR